jgi:site-specific recombinase XerD
MSALAPTVQAFFVHRLLQERDASPHTIAAYRDTIRLLLLFAATRRGREPSLLDIADLDADTVAAFLDHLQTAATTPCSCSRSKPGYAPPN